jgi:hypothetical protein
VKDVLAIDAVGIAVGPDTVEGHEGVRSAAIVWRENAAIGMSRSLRIQGRIEAESRGGSRPFSKN